MELDVFEMVLLDEVDEMGVTVYSLVQQPANETEAVFLSKEKEKELVTLALDEPKKMIYSVALIPDQLIFRSNEKGNYNIVFKEETVRLTSQRALANGVNNFSFAHSGEALDGLKVTESWLVESVELDKSKAIGLNAPKGSWVLGFHADTMDKFNEVKDSGMTGLSIEGLFAREKVQMSMEVSPLDAIQNILKNK